MSQLEEMLEQFPDNVPAAAIDTAIKGHSVIGRYVSPVCFLRACRREDDVMIDLLTKFDFDKTIKYFVACTMQEYNLYDEHVKYLEDKYHVMITTAIVTTSQQRTIDAFACANKADLVITSERQYEDGMTSKHPTCVTIDRENVDSYRPLFWFNDDDVNAYDEVMNIVHAEVRT